MPRHDGTGPRGQGPMSGGGGGYCILKIPKIPTEPLAGFAGLSGKPVSVWADHPRIEIALLQAKARLVQSELELIERRLAMLETVGPGTKNPPRQAGGEGPGKPANGGVS